MRSLLKFVRLLVVFFFSLGFCQEVVASDPKGGKTPLAVEDRWDESAWDPFQDPAYEYVQGELLVKFKEQAKSQTISQVLDRWHAKIVYTSPHLGFHRVEIPKENDLLEAVRNLNQDPNVEWANFNYMAKACWVPNDTYYSYQWHYPKINMPQAWDITKGSPNVIAAVVDQGFYPQHPDLQCVVTVSGYDFVDDDNDPTEDSTYSHGAHVAGTILACTDNDTGVAGIAPQCKLMPVRVMLPQGGTIQWIADGIVWAVNHEANVINLSLVFTVTSCPPPDPGPPLSTAIQTTADSGVVVVAASGNEDSACISYPAAYAHCIAVGATNHLDGRAPYSNHGPKLDLVAPGGDLTYGGEYGVLSTTSHPETGEYVYAFWQGTSMAAPHVTGAVALLLSHSRGMSVAEVRAALENTAVDLGSPGFDNEYGHGRIDVYAALNYGGPGEQDTLKYDDDTIAWAFPIPDEWGDDLFNVRFTPAWDYVLKSAQFLFYRKIGNGAVRIYVWEDTNGYPAEKIDSVDVPHANIQLAPSWTTVNFSKSITWSSLSDFHIGYTPLGPPATDTVVIISDNGLPEGTEHRSIEFCYGAWGTMFDDWGTDVNFMIRAVVEKLTDVEEEQFTVAEPTRYELFQNYPNPFNPQTKIRYYLPEATWVNLTIYNLLGQRVRTLVDEYQNAGAKAMFWDGKDEKGNQVASGIYFHQLKTEEFSQTRKMVLIR
ncbi:MAG: S8 family serine peptidase [candidate division Zixibacteria bacterium]|nr:S8 family serine peptidase [candidate division Zixibacteria bacterium]